MFNQPQFTDLPIMPGAGDQPKVVLAASDGARAEIYLHGAQVTAWVPAGEPDSRLFLSQSADFSPASAIRGGVPVIFPQFSNFGPLQSHGFARRIPWALSGSAAAATASAFFELRDDEATRALWPHAFQAVLVVTVGGPALSVALTVSNPGVEPLSFTCALHTYLHIADIHATRIEGLGGSAYLDSSAGRVQRTQPEGALAFTGEVDRIYPAAPDALVVVESDRRLRIERPGFPDVVVWNPWEARGAGLSDLEPEGYRHMLCIEPAVILQPVTLAPGQSWTGTQRLVS
jgi:glucose-6-phosphate 1-epimerase